MEILEGFVIADAKEKQRILESISDFKNYIFLSFEELVKKLYGEVKKEAIFLLMEEYGLSYDLAKEYMHYIPYVEEKTYKNLKLDSLASARAFLLKKDMLEKDDFFLYRLPQFPVTFVHPYHHSLYESVKRKVMQYTKVYEIEEPKNTYQPKVYSFSTMVDEVYGVCNEIMKLHEQNIPYSNMYITYENQQYEALLHRMSMTYGIPFAFGKKKGIAHTPFAKKVFELIDQKNSFTEIVEELPDSPFVESFIQWVSSYHLRDKNPKDYKEFLRRELAYFAMPDVIYEDMVHLERNATPGDGEYIFYVGLNQGEAPKIYKDEEYLKDSELKELGLVTSIERNCCEKEEMKSLFTHTKNLWISFKNMASGKECKPSILIESLSLMVETRTPEYGYSRVEDKARLATYLSVLEKIEEKNPALDIYSTKNLEYKSFDHSYTGIDPKYMEKRFTEEKPLAFAYSNMKYYFECPFHFYLERILDLSTFDSTTATRLGTYSHGVLEDSYKEGFDFEKSIVEWKTQELSKLDPTEYAKDEFYFDQMKSVLGDLIQFNRNHEGLSKLNYVKTEEHVEVIEGNLKFHGYIDKLMYTEIAGEIYAAIMDYKTGKDYITLDNVWDGFHLQLPSYMYLLSKYEPFKDKKIHILGIYLQKVNMIALDNTIDIVAQKEKSFRLQGYSIKDMSLLSMLDPSYTASDYIASMNVTKSSGGFGAYAKVITATEEDELIQLVDDLIHRAHKGVMQADFSIAPKRINGKDQSCTFCKYKDICFRSYKDYVELEPKEFPKKEETEE